MIYYLIQGEAYQYPLRIAEMQDSGAKIIFLTWDKPVNGAFFLPNSTWAQGRDFLINHVLKNNYKFEYLVLMDGDAKPIKGNWKQFNVFLLKRKPQICLPLMIRASGLLHRLVKLLYLPVPSYQQTIIFDEQVIAYRKDIIQQAVDIIHLRVFERISWWHGGIIRLAIIKSLVPRIIQFNDLQISNDSHSKEYPQCFDMNYITNYIKYIGLPNVVSFDRLPKNKWLSKVIKLFYCFIELFFWFPLPIKQYDINKNLEYARHKITKINKNHLN